MATARPRRSRSTGDPSTVLGEHGTDRLDTPTQPVGDDAVTLVLVDEPHERRCGRSSSAMLCQAATGSAASATAASRARARSSVRRAVKTVVEGLQRAVDRRLAGRLPTQAELIRTPAARHGPILRSR